MAQVGIDSGKPLGFSGLGDKCTQYDDNDNCVGWIAGPGGGSYSGVNLENVDAPSPGTQTSTAGATGNMPTVAQQQQTNALIAQAAGQLATGVITPDQYNVLLSNINATATVKQSTPMPTWVLVLGIGLLSLMILAPPINR